MMILDYYKKLSIPKWYFERKYYKIYKSKYTVGTSLSAVCYHLAKNNLECKLFYSESSIFKNDNYFIILSGMVNNSLHKVLLTGYDDNNFYVCDPLYKKNLYGIIIK